MRNLEPLLYLACRGGVARAGRIRSPFCYPDYTAQSMPTSQHNPRHSADDEMQTYDPKMIGGGRMSRAGVRS